MAVSALAGTALIITVASALTLNLETDVDNRGGMNTDLPRTVVQTGEEDGCGKNVTGYLLIGRGLLWKDHTLGYASDPTACRTKCDSAKNCVGFTTRYPRKGKMQCNLYQGLVQKYDPRSKAYTKCPKGYKCADGKDFSGFQLSHEGTWKDGVLGGEKTLGSCSKACRLDRSCVSFTYRHSKAGMAQCYHFKNAANEAGPQRDARANTFSKCALNQQKMLEKTSTKPSLPLFMSMLRKSHDASCGTGYVASSSGWWWPQYDKLTEVFDMQGCASECNVFQKCVSFIYRLGEKTSECFLYKGLDSKIDPTQVAFTKCPQAAPCDKSSIAGEHNMTNGHFRFSHYGSWEGGIQMTGIAAKGCNIICSSNPECTAMSWQREGAICTTYFFKDSSKLPTPTVGAQGYSKCHSIDVAEPQASEPQASEPQALEKAGAAPLPDAPEPQAPEGEEEETA